MATVLALDKDPLQLELLTLLLRRDRHRVVTTSEPETAFALLQAERFDLAVVEPALPRHDGYRVCREILQLCPEVSLIILSERDEEEQIVRGLLAGADDYIVKPYSPHVFLARVQVILRRAIAPRSNGAADGGLSVGEVSLNLSQFHVVINGRAVALSPREFALLHALMSHANRVLSRQQLMRLAWGDSYVGSPKAVDVCIQRIRKKIQPYLLNGSYIHALRGFGYKFEKPLARFPAVRPAGTVAKLLPKRPLDRAQSGG